LINYERNSIVAQFCRRVQSVTWNKALIKTAGKQMDDLLAPPPEDTSSSTPKNDPAPSRTSSSLAPLSQAASSSKSRQIDWWSFEYALTAGRRWLQIVRQRKSEQQKFALNNTKAEWNTLKKHQYAEFKRKHMRKDAATELGSARSVVNTSQRPDVQRVRSDFEQRSKPAALLAASHPERNPEQEGSRTSGNTGSSSLVEAAHTNSDMEHRPEQDTPLTSSGAEENLPSDEEVTGTTLNERPRQDISTFIEADPPSDITSTYSKLEDYPDGNTLMIRPSWVRRATKDKLSGKAAEEYMAIIKDNHGKRLGKGCWYWYEFFW
jgi:hypothetical protein